MDLSFADFGGSERLYPAPATSDDDLDSDKYLNSLAPPGGLEPPTHGLGNASKRKK